MQPKFGSCFQNGARTLALCQRRWESIFSLLPDEAIFYILNMCRWDWFGDNIDTLKDRRKREKQRKEQEQQQKKSPTVMIGSSTNQNDTGFAKSYASAVTSDGYSCIQSLDSVHGMNMNSTAKDEEDDEEYTDISVDTEDEEKLDVEEFESGSEDSSEDEDDYHRANRRYFSFKDPDSDEEVTEISAFGSQRNNWFRHHFARIDVLEALASMDDQASNEF